MSLYDTIHVGNRQGQVKCWRGLMDCYYDGWSVDVIEEGVISYDIAMREGGYVHVHCLSITGWDDNRNPSVPLYDKWGDPWVSETINVGEVGRELRDLGLAEPTYYFDRGE